MSSILSTGQPDHAPAGIWDYVSASRLNLWLKCPLAFKLRYIDGIVTPTSPALFVGRKVHAALESFYRHRQLDLAIAADQVARQLAETWGADAATEQVVFSSPYEEQACQRQAQDLVSAYLQKHAVDEPRPLAVETAVEAPLVDPATGEDLGIPLLGVIDLLLADPAGPLVVDFKTASRSAAPLEITHEIQLSSYAYLLRATSDRQEGGLEIRQLIKTRTPQVEFHRYGPRSERHFRRLFAVIRAYLDNLASGRFVFRPGFACQTCEFRDSHCRSWDG